jgi:hypothetical protein
MSAKVTIKTSMRSEERIIAALSSMGVPAQHILHAPEGKQVRGYGRSRSGIAQVVIRKEWHGGYGDVGFAKQSDGTYTVIMDDLDDRKLCRSLSLAKAGRGKFAQVSGQWYAATAAKKTLQLQGFTATIRQDGENLRVLAQQY